MTARSSQSGHFGNQALHLQVVLHSDAQVRIRQAELIHHSFPILHQDEPKTVQYFQCGAADSSKNSLVAQALTWDAGVPSINPCSDTGRAATCIWAFPIPCMLAIWLLERVGHSSPPIL